MSDSRHYSRGYLPHHQEPGATFAITFRLADSLPQAVLRKINEQSASLPAAKRNQAIANMLDSALDRGLGQCWLRRPDLAELVQSTLQHFDRERYNLLAWVIMPNHVHALITPLGEHMLAEIVRSWKGYTARFGNQLLGRSGIFWMRESFDRQIRGEDHLANVIEYIHHNPVKAGLVQQAASWPYSSASISTQVEAGSAGRTTSCLK